MEQGPEPIPQSRIVEPSMRVNLLFQPEELVYRMCRELEAASGATCEIRQEA